MHYLLLFLLACTVGCQNTTEQSSTKPGSVAITSKPTPPAPTPPAIHLPTAAELANVPKELALFDGKSLDGWANVETAGNGGVELVNGLLKVGMGADLSGVRWTNAAVLPRSNYEIELDAMKEQGTDFFCGLTFPVKDSFCSLILGGWGGAIVGLSSLDGMDASENDTSRSMYFEKNRWFHIKVRVTDEAIQTWIDDQKVIDVGIAGRKVSLRFGDIEMCKPLGLSTWQTEGNYKNIKLRRL
jgi:hypothetical protein